MDTSPTPVPITQPTSGERTDVDVASTPPSPPVDSPSCLLQATAIEDAGTVALPSPSAAKRSTSGSSSKSSKKKAKASQKVKPNNTDWVEDVEFRNDPRARWAFTLNNYTDEHIASLRMLLPHVRYLVAGKEVSTTGTRHLQGFVITKVNHRLNSIKKLFEGCGESIHFEMANCRTNSICADYCKKGVQTKDEWKAYRTEGPNYGKDSDVAVELGSYVFKQGKRSDLEEFMEYVTDRKTPADFPEYGTIVNMFPKVVAKYDGFVKKYLSLHQPKYDEDIEFDGIREWQQGALDYIFGLRSREILFVVDYAGNAGKSTFIDYFMATYPETKPILIQPGKQADMAQYIDDYEYKPQVFFFDCPRSKQGEYIQYSFLEYLKNGKLFVPKWGSRMTRLPRQLPVVVMMNEEPDMTKLSQDRYNILRIGDPPLVIETDPGAQARSDYLHFGLL